MTNGENNTASEIKVGAVFGTGPGKLLNILATNFRDETPNRALAHSLAHICRYFNAHHFMVQARLGTNILAEEWSDDPDMWGNYQNLLMAHLEADENPDIVTDKAVALPLVKGITSSQVLLLTPLSWTDQEGEGIAAMIVPPCKSPEQLACLLSRFDEVLGFITSLIAQSNDSFMRPTESIKDVMQQVFSQGGQVANGAANFAAWLADDLRKRYGLNLVSIGFIYRGRLEIMAQRGTQHENEFHSLRQAMKECLKKGTNLLYPGYLIATEKPRGKECPRHATWSNQIGGETTASLLLKNMDQVVGVVTLRNDSVAGLRTPILERFARELKSAAPLIPLSQQASQSISRHGLKTGLTLFNQFKKKGALFRLAGIAAFVFLVWWIGFTTLPYSVTVPSLVIPAKRQVICCPQEGILQKVLVTPGDKVKPGQLLAYLDGRSVRLERDQLKTRIKGAADRIDQARAANEPGNARVERAKLVALNAEFRMVTKQLETLKIYAPYGGVIIKGDLRDQQGGVLAQGTQMFEIAQNDLVKIQLKIPANRFTAGTSRTSGSFAPNANRINDCPVTGIIYRPILEKSDAIRILIGESEPLKSTTTLKPGMEGVTHLDLGEKPVWWIFTHGLTDWLRLNFWL